MKLIYSQKELKTSILVLFFFVFSMNCAMADTCTGNVNIPDANFKTTLLAIAGLDANSDEEIECSEAITLTDTLNVSNKSISDLTGIEAFTNIKGLRR